MFDLPEKATVWNKGKSNGFGGFDWDGPHVIDCRIAYVTKKFTSTNGDDLTSTAVMYADSEKLTNKSVVLFGESSATEPAREANDVRQLSKTPSGTNMAKAWFA